MSKTKQLSVQVKVSESSKEQEALALEALELLIAARVRHILSEGNAQLGHTQSSDGTGTVKRPDSSGCQSPDQQQELHQ